MANNVLVNDTVRVQVTFRDWSESDEGSVVDPATVTVDILDDTLTRTPATEAPVKVNEGIYRFDWTPEATGRFYIEFVGTYEGGVVTAVREEFIVTTTPTSGAAGSDTLEEDIVLEFATELDPLYVDPDELADIYPEATRLEILEAIHRFSLDVKALLKLEDDEFPDFLGQEYIRAATLCALAKVHDATVGGMELTLGDLRIADQNSSSTAGGMSPCDLAAQLRRQLARTGMLSVVRGARNPNPMPSRVMKFHRRAVLKDYGHTRI